MKLPNTSKTHLLSREYWLLTYSMEYVCKVSRSLIISCYFQSVFDVVIEIVYHSFLYHVVRRGVSFECWHCFMSQIGIGGFHSIYIDALCAAVRNPHVCCREGLYPPFISWWIPSLKCICTYLLTRYWFLDFYYLRSYLASTYSPYIVLIVAFSGILTNGGLDVDDRASSPFVAALLIIAVLGTIAKVIMGICLRNQPTKVLQTVWAE